MTRHVVVDSCVMVKWFVPEEYSEEALSILDDHLDGRVTVVAPFFGLLEFANALRKYVARGVLSGRDALEAYDLLLEVGVEFRRIEESLVRRALQYSNEKGVTVYDAYYIVLAQELSTVFYTADEKLVRRLKGEEPIVRHVCDYPRVRSAERQAGNR